jgi:hypothetical protein
MRTYGRLPPDPITGYRQWVQVTTDPNGYDDDVWITTLAQVLLLNLGESPFYANYGIPAHQTIMTQVFPDYYIIFTQKLFADKFSSLIISKQAGRSPVYNVNITTNQGVKRNASIPIPT